jgi:DNA-binding NarL/FixJ family response regulator
LATRWIDLGGRAVRDAEERPETNVDGLANSRIASPLRIALLGDRALCSACLRALLRECDDAFTAVDAKSASDMRPPNEVDIAVLPLLCPQASTLAEIGEVVRALGRVPLVLLIDRGEPQVVNQLIALGVRGVLTLDVDMKIVAAALRLVVAGGIYVPPQPLARGAAQAATAHRLGEPTGGRLDRLSPRERAVLDLLRRSLSNREIAGMLGIAEATVKIHVRNLLRKTHARNRVELALLAAARSA